MNIYIDFHLPEPALACLREGTRNHRLLFSPSPAGTVLASGTLDPAFADADIAIGQPDPAGIAAAPRLQWVHISSSGITRYDTPAFQALAAERRLALTHSAHVYNQACAEHALSFILANARQLPQALATRRFDSGDAWLTHRSRCIPLRGQHLLIVGFGAIGEHLATLLQPLRMTLTGYRRRIRGTESIPMISGESALNTALARADHIVNILPESPSTRNLFDAARLRLLKPGAVFYNIGRGATVDHHALHNHFQHDPSFRAWLDVTDPEPLPDDHPLWHEPRCHITPHVAGGHRDEMLTLVRHFLDNLRRFEQNLPLHDRVW